MSCQKPLCTYCSIHKGFSVVFKSSIICFLMRASFRLVSVGIEITQFFRQQQSTMKLMAPTKSTMSSAMMAAKAMSNSSCRLAVYAGMTFSIAKPWRRESSDEMSSFGCSDLHTYTVIILQEIIFRIDFVQNLEHRNDVFGFGVDCMQEQI